MTVPRPSAAPVRRYTAPLARLLRSEVTLVVRRPRTAVTLGTLVLIPLLAAAGLRSMDDTPSTVLNVAMVTVSEVVAPVLMVPVVLVAADAFAAERGLRTLDQLLIAPVGTGRLVALKGVGVLAAAALTAAVTLTAALLAGLALLPLGPYSFGSTLGRTIVIAVWLTGQLAGYGVLLLPLSLLLRRTTSVVAAGLGPAVLGILRPVLPHWVTALVPSGNWLPTMSGLSTVPADLSTMAGTTLRAVVYVLVGVAVSEWLLSRRGG